MQTRTLETLLWVVRLGGIGATARHLNLTQPGISRRIRELEHELGAKLFQREGRRIVLTPIGRRCITMAERIVSDVAALRQATSGDASASGLIRLGVSEVIAVSWLRRLLARIERDYPNLHLELDVDLSARLVRKLEAHEADLVLAPGPLAPSGSLKVALGTSRLRWMARPGLLRGKQRIRPSDIASLTIITLARDAHVNAIMENWFNNAGVRPKRIDYCNSLSVVALLVREGFGVSLLPEELFGSRLKSNELVVLPVQPAVPRVEYWAIYVPAPELPVLQRIARLAREESWFLHASHKAWREIGI